MFDFTNQAPARGLQAFKDAIYVYKKVATIFPHKATPLNSSVQTYTQFLESIVNHSIFNTLHAPWILRHNIGIEGIKSSIDNGTFYDHVRDAFILYARLHDNPITLERYCINDTYFTSELIRYVSKLIRDKEFLSLIQSLTPPDTLVEGISKTHKRNPMEALTKLVLWYRENKSRLECVSAGTFQVSPLHNEDTFIVSVLIYMNAHGIMHLDSPLWYQYKRAMTDTYSIQWEGTTFQAKPVTNYDHNAPPIASVLEGGIYIPHKGYNKE